MRQVAQIMGMPISIDIPECSNKTEFKYIFNVFSEIDKKFSPYKKSSQVSLFRDGKISSKALSEELEEIIKKCKHYEALTNGYFSAWASGKFDPSGFVKGWAINKASIAIKNFGYKTFCISAGGDILAKSSSEKVWNIGIQNPSKKDQILGFLKAKNLAIATSGNYERGEHIYNPKDHKLVSELMAVTIVGKDVVEADVLATACFAAGNGFRNILTKNKGYDFLVVDSDSKIFASSDMPQLYAP